MNGAAKKIEVQMLEQHGLTAMIFAVINTHLGEQGLMLREGTIVDATLIAAPRPLHNCPNLASERKT